MTILCTSAMLIYPVNLFCFFSTFHVFLLFLLNSQIYRKLNEKLFVALILAQKDLNPTILTIICNTLLYFSFPVARIMRRRGLWTFRYGFQLRLIEGQFGPKSDFLFLIDFFAWSDFSYSALAKMLDKRDLSFGVKLGFFCKFCCSQMIRYMRAPLRINSFIF